MIASLKVEWAMVKLLADLYDNEKWLHELFARTLFFCHLGLTHNFRLIITTSLIK